MKSATHSPTKIGIGEIGPTGDCVNRLGVAWYYNWKPTGFPDVTETEFVPMIWNTDFLRDKVFADLAQTNSSGHLLGFNEPERKDQANMSAAIAIKNWPHLEQTGFRLGSPAVSLDKKGKSWLRRFMQRADQQNARVDFVCVHWYGDITLPDATDQLRTALEEVHQEYQRPLWLTEFGAMDQWFQVTNDREAATAEFLKKALSMLDALPFVERFAWFTCKPLEDYRASALFDESARCFTPAGEAYAKRTAPNHA